MQITEEFATALELMETTRRHLFITGDAGTGKTTLIQHFLETTKKRCVVLAPTGIAAVKAGGQTIHSFFQLPPRTIGYDQIVNLSNYPAKKLLVDNVDTIIIDEASMIRADMMDIIFNYFKKNYNSNNFANKQIILVGDLNQLPPVVASTEEAQMIANRYGGSEFFFSAKCWKETELNTIRLTKIFRQTDEAFISFLNKAKNNTLQHSDIDAINNICYDPDASANDGILLASTNDIASQENSINLALLQAKQYRFEGESAGEFNVKNCPVDQVIKLKIGCPVMIVLNVKDDEGKFICHNGTMATFEGYDEQIDEIICSGIRISRNEFNSIKYKYNQSSDSISSDMTGGMRQFPIKLAYAITIHKAQGQTFDNVVIDVGQGSFAHGQMYVAISRCRTMEGIKLKKKLKLTDFIYNVNVTKYNNYVAI